MYMYYLKEFFPTKCCIHSFHCFSLPFTTFTTFYYTVYSLYCSFVQCIHTAHLSLSLFTCIALASSSSISLFLVSISCHCCTSKSRKQHAALSLKDRKWCNTESIQTLESESACRCSVSWISLLSVWLCVFPSSYLCALLASTPFILSSIPLSIPLLFFILIKQPRVLHLKARLSTAADVARYHL